MTFPEGDPINARGRNALYIIILFLGAAGMVAIAFRGYLMENNQTHQPAVISPPPPVLPPPPHTINGQRLPRTQQHQPVRAQTQPQDNGAGVLR